MTMNVRVHSQNGYATVTPSNADVDAQLKSSGSSVALALRGASSPRFSTSFSARRSPPSKPPSPHKDQVLIRVANARNQPQRETDGQQGRQQPALETPHYGFR